MAVHIPLFGLVSCN